MNSVYIHTYGCTLNQADSDMMKAILYDKGYEISDSEGDSDVVVLNTCTVKGATESKILSKMQKLKDEGKLVVIAGCMSVNTQKIRRVLPLAPIVWAGAVASIGEAVQDAIDGKGSEYRQPERKEKLPKFFTKPILRIPISEGCLSFCHFCQTKFARPGLRSVSISGIKEWIRHGYTHGAREVQLTSMDAGAYGRDLKTDVVELMKEVNALPQDFHARMAMANPDHIEKMMKEVVEQLKGPRFYKFLHVPVQSGSEKVCREMNRDHMAKDFTDVVEYARQEIPEITIMTDIIVGYPTETEEDFETSCKMLKATRPDVTNVSKFSPRPKTKAAGLKQLDNLEVKRRSIIMSALAKKMSEERNRELIGKTYEALITEKNEKTGDFTGRNVNYKQIVVKGFEGHLGEKTMVKVTNATYGSIIGKLV